MKKNQKGITIVGLLITVIVLATIASTCIYTGKNMVGEAKLEQLRTNMLLIQAKCQGIEEKFIAKELIADDYIGEVIITEDTLINNYEVNISENDKWYKLSKKDIEEKTYTVTVEGNTIEKQGLGLGNIGGDDNYYVVNYNNGEVVYTKGYKHSDGHTYYTLTEIKGL